MSGTSPALVSTRPSHGCRGRERRPHQDGRFILGPVSLGSDVRASVVLFGPLPSIPSSPIGPYHGLRPPSRSWSRPTVVAPDVDVTVGLSNPHLVSSSTRGSTCPCVHPGSAPTGPPLRRPTLNSLPVSVVSSTVPGPPLRPTCRVRSRGRRRSEGQGSRPADDWSRDVPDRTDPGSPSTDRTPASVFPSEDSGRWRPDHRGECPSHKRRRVVGRTM